MRRAVVEGVEVRASGWPPPREVVAERGHRVAAGAVVARAVVPRDRLRRRVAAKTRCGAWRARWAGARARASRMPRTRHIASRRGSPNASSAPASARATKARRDSLVARTKRVEVLVRAAHRLERYALALAEALHVAQAHATPTASSARTRSAARACSPSALGRRRSDARRRRGAWRPRRCVAGRVEAHRLRVEQRARERGRVVAA